MELNDSAKNGDVETGWDSSEVGADAEIEYVPLMRVENSSSPSQQPNTATLNQHTIEGISTPHDPCGWDGTAFKKFVLFWFGTCWVVFGVILKDKVCCGNDIVYGILLFPLLFVITFVFRFCCYNIFEKKCNDIEKKCNDIFETLRKIKFFKGYENF